MKHLQNQVATGLILITLVMPMVSGCYGRIDDPEVARLPFSREDLETAPGAGLTAGGRRPLVLGFSALWCKPCIREVSVLNEAAREFSGSVDVMVLLVEGARKGDLPKGDDAAALRGPDGERPQFGVSVDPGWRKYRALRPAQVRNLPFMLIADQDDRLVFAHEGSLPYSGGLQPILAELTGAAPAPGGEDDAPVAHMPRNVPVSEWLAAPGRGAGSESEHWLLGVMTEAATRERLAPESVIFDGGVLSISAWGTPDEYVAAVRWETRSNCELNVNLDRSGRVTATMSVCRG